ncbi:hypothetical protein O181_130621 [Austropuccinia psidii MF-1]|uniref:Uncharacterized protein n=1 Tax=Austropuccinia psidii MF-1 TaxID=1389203 RepID=A0A9Q3L340_9BASI|nr:hypothetical protein [Austropuccinia psidii MF-1]
MPVHHSPPAIQTRSQAVLTPISRVCFDGNPAVPQLRANFGRSNTIQEGRKRAKKIKFIFRSDGEEEEESYVEEKESDRSEGAPTPVGTSQGTGGPTLAQSNKPVSHQSKPSLLEIMKQMTQIMANLQEASRPPALNTPCMKAPECFDGTQPFKFISFIQSHQLIFHNHTCEAVRYV